MLWPTIKLTFIEETPSPMGCKNLFDYNGKLFFGLCCCFHHVMIMKMKIIGGKLLHESRA
jgi:hypothetical protein